MEYVVIRSFTDKDTQVHYTVGERYPRRGFASKARVAELSTTNNKRGVELIAEKKVSVEKVVVPENIPESVPETPVGEVSEQESTYYTKADIMAMTVSKLRKLAKEQGVKNADSLQSAKLKEALIEKMGL